MKRPATIDAAIYSAGAGFALWNVAAARLIPHRTWGGWTWWAFVGAAVASLVLRSLRSRALLLTVVVALTAVVPMVRLAVERLDHPEGRAQSEVLVIEAMAERLIDTGTPYLDPAEIEAEAVKPRVGFRAYGPYHPAMAAFGVPRALLGERWWNDARIAFALATALGALVALVVAGVDGAGRLRVAQALAVVPPAGLTIATGGDDLPVIAVALVGFALAGRGRAGWSGVAAGVALATKLTALPIVAVLAALAWSRGRRSALGRFLVGAVGIPAATLAPIGVGDPDAMVENLIRYPFGMTERRSPAASPLPGRLLADHVPGGTAIALALCLAVGAVFAWWLLRRPPTTATAAAAAAATAMAAVVLVAPAARFGYVVYPVCLAVWSCAARDHRGRLGADGSHQGGDPDVLRGDGRRSGRPAPTSEPAGPLRG